MRRVAEDVDPYEGNGQSGNACPYGGVRLPCVKGAPATAGEGLSFAFLQPLSQPSAATSPYTGEAVEDGQSMTLTPTKHICHPEP